MAARYAAPPTLSSSPFSLSRLATVTRSAGSSLVASSIITLKIFLCAPL